MTTKIIEAARFIWGYLSGMILMTILLWMAPIPVSAIDLPLELISLPPGFSIGIFSDEVPGARSLAQGPGGTVFVSTRSEGRVYALEDTDNDGHADRVHTIARGLNMPNGVAFRGGSLYVAEVSRVLRFDRIEERLESPPKPVVVKDDLPRDRAHGWKFIRFGPDDRLYVPIGGPCNVCLETDQRYATISRMKPDGSGWEIYARGVRNSVGFDWHPATGDLWFTDNGRDRLGDNIPPDELNRAPTPDLHFGFPFWHGRDVPDPEFGKGKKASEFALPVQELGPHVAALGMRFYTGRQFPEEYRNQILIAEHGSWNRSIPIGYRLSLVRLDASGTRALSYETFADGWLQAGVSWGRPVDLMTLADGSLLVTDDKAGVVYRITYRGS